MLDARLANARAIVERRMMRQPIGYHDAQTRDISNKNYETKYMRMRDSYYIYT
jgi:hypothetical protein